MTNSALRAHVDDHVSDGRWCDISHQNVFQSKKIQESNLFVIFEKNYISVDFHVEEIFKISRNIENQKLIFDHFEIVS